MSDTKATYTKAEVDKMIEEAKGAGLMSAAEFLGARADDLEGGDKDYGWMEAEVAILRWASARVGQL